MKIIIVGPVFPWRGGIAHHSASLANRLRNTHEVEMVTFSRQYPSFLFPGKSQYDTAGQPPLVPIHQWIDSINPFSWLVTARRIRKLKPDIVVFAYSLPYFAPCYGIIAALIRWGTRARALFLCHNIVPHEKHFGDELLTRFAFAFSDYFIVQSRGVENDLLRLVPRAKYVLSPHPIYEKFGPPQPKREARPRLRIEAPKVLLYFGYIRPYKGVTVLIDALKQLVDGGMTDMLLLIVGEFYDDEERYRRKIRELHIDAHVRIVSEYVPNDEVPLYFSAADVVILPYLSATQSGIAQIAYNFNTPMIATDVGGLAEVVVDGKTGIVVPAGDPTALASAIRRFYESGMEGELAAGVAAEKKRYSWETFISRLEELVRFS